MLSLGTVSTAVPTAPPPRAREQQAGALCEGLRLFWGLPVPIERQEVLGPIVDRLADAVCNTA